MCLSVHDIVGLPAGTVGLHSGPLKSAADSLDLEIKGVGGHGALPQNTKDPIPLAAAISVNEAQRKMLLNGIQRIATNEARAYGMPEDFESDRASGLPRRET